MRTNSLAVGSAPKYQPVEAWCLPHLLGPWLLTQCQNVHLWVIIMKIASYQDRQRLKSTIVPAKASGIQCRSWAAIIILGANCLPSCLKASLLAFFVSTKLTPPKSECLRLSMMANLLAWKSRCNTFLNCCNDFSLGVERGAGAKSVEKVKKESQWLLKKT